MDKAYKLIYGHDDSMTDSVKIILKLHWYIGLKGMAIKSGILQVAEFWPDIKLLMLPIKLKINEVHHYVWGVCQEDVKNTCWVDCAKWWRQQKGGGGVLQ